VLVKTGEYLAEYSPI